MTVINQNSTVTANGNGVTTEWPYTFNIPDSDAVRVGLFEIATNNLVELDPSDFSITGLGEDAGGEVTYPLIGAPITSAFRLVIWRELEYTQDTDLTNQTPYYPEVLETQLDRIVMQIQQLSAEADRSIKVTLGSDLDPDEFVEELQEGAAEAAASAAAAAASLAAVQVIEDNVEAIQSSITLPADPTALNYLRRNAADTAYEDRTPAQVLSDIAAIGTVQQQVFTASGTYTPTAGMKFCIIECVGGGGSGGSADGTTTSGLGAGGGGSGGYSRKRSTAAAIGASQVVTIGAGGAAPAVGANNGNAGGDTSVGALCIAKGGSGGLYASSGQVALGGAGGIPGTGDLAAAGDPGKHGGYMVNTGAPTTIVILFSGEGGSSFFGGGGRAVFGNGTAVNGNAGSAYGSGGSGAAVDQVTTDVAGGAGSAGIVIITEFL